MAGPTTSVVKIDLSLLPLTFELDAGMLEVRHGDLVAAHPFDDKIRDALLEAADGRAGVSASLASALSFFAFVFSLNPRLLNGPRVTPVPVIVGGKTYRLVDIINIVGSAFLLLTDPLYDTCHARLSALLLAYLPASRQRVDLTQLPRSLAEGAIFSFLYAQRAASFFSPAKKNIGPVAVPCAAQPALCWLSHYKGIVDLLCELVGSHLLPLYELVAVCLAIFDGRAPEAVHTQDAGENPILLGANIVAAALDISAGRACRLSDIAAVTRLWLERTAFPSTVTDRELSQVTERKTDDELYLWACGVPAVAAPTPSSIRISGLLLDPGDWAPASATGNAAARKRRGAESVQRSPVKRAKIAGGQHPSDIIGHFFN